MFESPQLEKPRSMLTYVIRRTLAGPSRFETWHVPALVEREKRRAMTLEGVATSLEHTDGQD